MVKLKPALQKVQTHLAASGYFPAGVGIGEPKSAPPDVYAAIFLGDSEVTGTTLATSIERREIIIRLYLNAIREPLEDTEFLLDELRTEIMAALFGDFTLDMAGIRRILATEVTSRPGYQEVSGTIFRVMDITVPLEVDDSATFAP